LLVTNEMSETHAPRPQLVPPDRRASLRLPGSAVPWLTALSARSAELKLLDISDGGALIETPTRWKPGDRESFLLQGDGSVRIAGRVLRAEVTRLTPGVHYRSAIQFAAPVSLRALLVNAKYAQSGAALSEVTCIRKLVGRLAGVQAIRISSSLSPERGTESVYFEVPTSLHGERRVMQVFLAPHQLLTPEEFVQLKTLALVASGLPDLAVTLR
jgi:PilZ domain-containing protein